jgi:predicted nuclease of predicted toxin-antitoxin system
MKFLLNMNTPRALGRKLIGAGHECRHVGDIGMERASDVAIMEEAKINQEIIVTHDLDYGHLLAFSGAPSPSVIIFRLRNTHPDNLYARLMSTWPRVEKSLMEGAIVVLEDAALRIRKLPIGQRSK